RPTTAGPAVPWFVPLGSYCGMDVSTTKGGSRLGSYLRTVETPYASAGGVGWLFTTAAVRPVTTGADGPPLSTEGTENSRFGGLGGLPLSQSSISAEFARILCCVVLCPPYSSSSVARSME